MTDDDLASKRRRRIALDATIAGIGALLLAVLGIATNQATQLLPKSWSLTQSPQFWWAIVASLSLIVTGLTVWQVRSSARQSDAGSAAQSRPVNPPLPQQTGTPIGGVVVENAQLQQAHLGTALVGAPASATPTASNNNQRLWNIPAPVHSFTDRENLISTMRQELRDGQQKSPVSTVVLYGMGGVGKTQVVRAYAQQHIADYSLGWWISAETPAVTEATLAELAMRLGARADLPSSHLARQLPVLLAERPVWLLIFDNSSTPAELEQYLPTIGDGHILITSRTRAWAGIAEPVAVDVLSLPAAVELLRVRTRDDDRAAAEQLAEELGRLSLALEQAAAYCAEYHTSLEGYLTLFRTRRSDLLKRGRPLAYQGTVDTVFTLLIDEISATDPAAIQLLQLCSLLAPDAIPVGELLDHATHLPQPLAGAAVDEVLRNDAISGLTARACSPTTSGGPHGSIASSAM